MLAKRMLTIFITLPLILALAACGSAAEEQTGPEELTPVTLVLDWTPNVNHIGAYVALAQGWFEEQGLGVSIIEPGDNLALQLVAAGQAEFGYSYQEEVTYARPAGAAAVSIAAVIQHNTSCFAAPVENGIKSVADFQGKVYGGWGGQVEEALIAYLLEKEGFQPQVTCVNLGSSDFFAATQGGEVDFSWIFYGTTGAEAQTRSLELDTIMLRDLDPAFDYYTPVIVAEQEWLATEEHRETARAFLAALSQGYEYAAAQPQQAAELMCSQTEGLDPDQVSAGAQLLAGEWISDAPAWGRQELAVWQGFATWLYEQGLLQQELDAEAAFSNEYLPK